MRLCNNLLLATFFAGATLTLGAQQAPSPALPASNLPASTSPASTSTAAASQAAPTTPAARQAPSLTVDRDPVRSPDGEAPNAAAGAMRKEGTGFVLHTDVEEVVLNATVLEGNKLVPDLKGDNFQVTEDRKSVV